MKKEKWTMKDTVQIFFVGCFVALAVLLVRYYMLVEDQHDTLQQAYDLVLEQQEMLDSYEMLIEKQQENITLKDEYIDLLEQELEVFQSSGQATSSLETRTLGN